MKSKVFTDGQRGSTMAEFAVVSLIFFMLIFGIIEFGRLLYTHNALTDASRRGARYAVLNQESETCVKNATVYGETHISAFPTCTPTGPALITGLTPDNVTVEYQGADLDGDPDTDPTDYGMNLGAATVKIQNFTFDLGVPLVHRTLTMPDYITTLPAESAGQKPDDL